MVKRMLPLLALVFLLAVAAGCKTAGPAPVQPATPQLTPAQYYQQGIGYFQQEQWAHAQSSFQYAVDMDPNYVDAWYYLALTYHKQNMLRNAEEAAKRAAVINPRFLPAREFLGILYFQKPDFLAAKMELEAARSLGSRDPNVFVALGEIYLSENRCKDALDALNHAMALDPGNVRGRDALSRAKAKCGGKPPKKSAPPKPQPKTQFKGGAKAISPSDF
jgi:Tfp pilus assembly protein PilF